jgi:DNA ligase-1
MSEKMDGIRAFWNGEKLLSKHSKDISVPLWFSEGIPHGHKLDGEFWIGRGQFERTIGTLNSSLDSTLWKDIKYVLFDIIIPNMPYEQRIEELKKLQLPAHLSVINTRPCLGNNELMKELNAIVADGGEGLVVTKPGSVYVSERTRNRQKIKVKFQLVFN